MKDIRQATIKPHDIDGKYTPDLASGFVVEADTERTLFRSKKAYIAVGLKSYSGTHQFI